MIHKGCPHLTSLFSLAQQSIGCSVSTGVRMRACITTSVVYAVFLVSTLFTATQVVAQQSIPAEKIETLQTQLSEAITASSSARKKLGVRRAIRACEALLEENEASPNRFAVLGLLFQAQQAQVKLDNSATNRRAFLTTCEKLLAAPDEYAAVRLDADLLLSQAKLAQQGADQKARAQAIKPLVQRYLGTEVDTKAVRVALTMGIEMGDAGLIGHLRQVIAEEFPGDREMINFQRDKLAGQVFGAPFIGQFKGADGKAYRFPMDALGKTTALYFWTKEGDGIEALKEMVAGWNIVSSEAERNTPLRYQFISFNLDNLPDAGASILSELGLDWPALHLPSGTEHPVYKTYVRNTPKLLTMTPSGYTAMVMSGSTRVKPGGWERSFGSSLARVWTKQDYTAQTRAMLSGEFTVVDLTGAFDPTAPPEWQAIHETGIDSAKKLTRTSTSVPEDTLNVIQACFLKPPTRYEQSYEQIHARFRRANELCQQAITAHPQAEDLWIVRNRRIVALLALWKIEGKRQHFDAAAQEAQATLDNDCPAGTDVIARFCLARQTLRSHEGDARDVIEEFAQVDSTKPRAVTTDTLASLLALDIGDRALHERYRRASLDQYANHPALWTATACQLDRYHRYWLYHPPFTAGWTYGRRMDYFFGIGDHENAERRIKGEFMTLDGKPFRIPEDLNGQFTMLEFLQDAAANPRLRRYGTFVNQRPFDDVQTVYAVLDDDAKAMREALETYNQEQLKRKQPPDSSTYILVPDGLDHPIVGQLNVTPGEKRNNIAFLHSDGRVAAFKSGLTAGRSTMAQSVVEWNDEQLVDDALARGDLKEAQRLAFAHAPVNQQPPPDAPKNWKPKEIGTVHLRARAKVYAAMGEWELAKEDAQAAYLAINSKAGHISMRTDDLDEIEKLRDSIQAELNQSAAGK
ncbi:hypothetical protein SV7mr_18140 [Stieleria bergensis]|uniref:Uncharacterized protein n=2 Tax=Stieleria bergensis TaxID=2528025 RepID=A0A517ST55_9BACT|nr:hypothetical protein SV7mr_18140 [Planctomycetes bacterium SV_7m_r]